MLFINKFHVQKKICGKLSNSDIFKSTSPKKELYT